MKRGHLVASSAVAICLASSGCTASRSTGPQPPLISAQVNSTSPRAAALPSAATTASSSTGANPPSTSAPYPTAPPIPSPESDQTSVLNSLPGSSSFACATVGTQATVRAGSIAAGDFAAARAAYTSAAKSSEVPVVNLYVIPQDAHGMKRVTITMVAIASGATKTVTSSSVAQAGAWSYFAVRLPVPSPATYRLRIVSGVNRGCFDVTFSR